MPVNEAGLRGRIREALLREGCTVDTNHGSARTGRGRSDLTVCCAGRFVAIEVKAGKEQPRADQIRYLKQVVAAGGVAFVGRSIVACIAAIRAIQQGGHPQVSALTFEFEGEPASPPVFPAFDPTVHIPDLQIAPQGEVVGVVIPAPQIIDDLQAKALTALRNKLHRIAQDLDDAVDDALRSAGFEPQTAENTPRTRTRKPRTPAPAAPVDLDGLNA